MPYLGEVMIESPFDHQCDKDTATLAIWLLTERKLSDYVDGGDDE